MTSISPVSKSEGRALIGLVVLLVVHLLLNVILLVKMEDKPPLAILSTLVILTVLILLLIGYVSKPSNVLRFKWPCFGLLLLHLVVSGIFTQFFGSDGHKLFAAVSFMVVLVSTVSFGLVVLWSS